jgi:Concanavalin A-like lectin/glucanases superfamily
LKWGTGTCSNDINTTVIGDNSDNNPNNDWDGRLDDVRVYNRALSATDVANLYAGGSIGATRENASSANLTMGTTLGPANGLVGHWTFDGADVTDKVYDRSGQGNNGYWNGSATSSAKTIGKLGQALNFNGTTNFGLLAMING